MKKAEKEGDLMEKTGRKTAVVSEYELMRQREFCSKVNSVISKRYSAPPLACVVTYGCQQNVADSEHIKGMLAEMGYGFTEELKEIDDFIKYRMKNFQPKSSDDEKSDDEE
jgi:hypothetical protein